MKVLVQYHVILKIERAVEAPSLKDAIDQAARTSRNDLVTVKRGLGINDSGITVDSVTLAKEPSLYD